MSISVTKDHKTGSTSVDEFDEKSIRDAVHAAEQLSDLTPANPESVPPLGPQKYSTADNWVDSTARARNPVLVPHVKAIIDAAKAKGLVAAGYFERSAGHFAIANKAGNFGFGRYTDSYSLHHGAQSRRHQFRMGFAARRAHRRHLRRRHRPDAPWRSA